MHTEEVDIQPNMTVRLKTNAELLDEVMVVAYGTPMVRLRSRHLRVRLV